MLADLHTHSTASDGQYTPPQLVRLARDRGLSALALTDHDTLAGLPAFLDAGRQLGLTVLPGVEVAAREYRSMHILGYGAAYDSPALRALCAEIETGREERKFRILDFLRDQGVALTLEEVEEIAGGGVIGRPHFARALVRRGYAKSSRDAFRRYLDTEEFARIERAKPPARACLDAIHAAGGVVSLAHPCRLRLTPEALDALVRELTGYGLDAIECRYPLHSPEQTAEYLALAEKYGLRVTGGSDFHGEAVKPDIALAAWDLDISWIPGARA